jgi:tetratricopeptide (TPR) repeat protein
MMAEPDVESTYQTRSQLAVSLERQGKLEEAEKIHVEVVKHMQHSVGLQHPDTVTCMSNLAQLLTKQRQFTKAVRLYTQCTAAYEVIYGPGHPATFVTNNLVGLNLWYDDKIPEAAEVMRRNQEMAEQTLGTENEIVYFNAYNLALVLEDLFEYAEAETQFVRAIKGFVGIFRMEHPTVNLVMRNFNSYLVNQGLHQEATTLARALKGPTMLSNANELCMLIDRLGLGGNLRSSDDHR